MTQGIRDFTNENFVLGLVKFQAGEVDGKTFRANVMQATVVKFGISIASAATHYNHALKAQRLADPTAVVNLGRADDKKGGRKPVHTVDVIKVKTGEVIASGISKGAAEQLIITAATKKKAKLAIKVVADAEVAPAVAVAATEAVAA